MYTGDDPCIMAGWSQCAVESKRSSPTGLSSRRNSLLRVDIDPTADSSTGGSSSPSPISPFHKTRQEIETEQEVAAYSEVRDSQAKLDSGKLQREEAFRKMRADIDGVSQFIGKLDARENVGRSMMWKQPEKDGGTSPTEKGAAGKALDQSTRNGAPGRTVSW
jgi:hypothetical protein